MSQPLLSIVIPTKDRYFYLKHLLNYLLKLDSENIEIVIQDNTSDNHEFLEYLEGIDYPHLKYAHVQDQIPISLNSDMAVLNSSGKYVCFIGDDDGVTSLIIPCVKYMEKNGIDVVVPEPVIYKWPDSYNVIEMGALNASLKYKQFKGNKQEVNTGETLMRLLRIGCSDRKGLPLLYHGIVRRSVLDKIYEKGNTFFPGPSPDIANGVALSLTDCKYYRIDMPITIAGSSKFRGGGARQMKNHASNIEDVPFLPPRAKENWEKRIPKIWTGRTVWCESSVKAMRYMGREDLVDKVNYEALYSSFVAYYFPLRGLAYNLTTNKMRLFVVSSWKLLKRGFNVALRLLHVKRSSDVIVGGINDIEAACHYLDSKYISFANNLE